MGWFSPDFSCFLLLDIPLRLAFLIGVGYFCSWLHLQLGSARVQNDYNQNLQNCSACTVKGRLAKELRSHLGTTVNTLICKNAEHTECMLGMEVFGKSSAGSSFWALENLALLPMPIWELSSLENLVLTSESCPWIFVDDLVSQMQFCWEKRLHTNGLVGSSVTCLLIPEQGCQAWSSWPICQPCKLSLLAPIPGHCLRPKIVRQSLWGLSRPVGCPTMHAVGFLRNMM